MWTRKFWYMFNIIICRVIFFFFLNSRKEETLPQKQGDHKTGQKARHPQVHKNYKTLVTKSDELERPSLANSSTAELAPAPHAKGPATQLQLQSSQEEDRHQYSDLSHIFGLALVIWFGIFFPVGNCISESHLNLVLVFLLMYRVNKLWKLWSLLDGIVPFEPCPFQLTFPHLKMNDLDMVIKTQLVWQPGKKMSREGLTCWRISGVDWNVIWLLEEFN